MITGGKSYDAYTTFEALFDKFSKQYKNISAFAIEDYVFITKPLSRKEYRDILNNEILSSHFYIIPLLFLPIFPLNIT